MSYLTSRVIRDMSRYKKLLYLIFESYFFNFIFQQRMRDANGALRVEGNERGGL